MERLAVGITVAALSDLAAEVTERVLLRLSDDETEYDVIQSAVETTGFCALKLIVDAIE